MKREIRFRVWDNDSKCFILPENLVLRLDGHLFDREFGDELHNVELMQFTGLKDKNGVDIYEGDIVKNHNKGQYVKKEYWYPLYLIKCKKDYLGITVNHVGGGLPSDNIMFKLENYSRELEVIGNIYKNPELITNK